jgi:coproporphyrinogen III oxidase-like Fe-S oxidoreductase
MSSARGSAAAQLTTRKQWTGIYIGGGTVSVKLFRQDSVKFLISGLIVNLTY